MIEIITTEWPTYFWYEVIKWCAVTFGYSTFGTEWFWQDDYSFYLSEKNLTMFTLRWL